MGYHNCYVGWKLFKNQMGWEGNLAIPAHLAFQGFPPLFSPVVVSAVFGKEILDGLGSYFTFYLYCMYNIKTVCFLFYLKYMWRLNQISPWAKRFAEHFSGVAATWWQHPKTVKRCWADLDQGAAMDLKTTKPFGYLLCSHSWWCGYNNNKPPIWE